MPRFRKKPIVVEAVQWYSGVEHPGVNRDAIGWYVVTIHGQRAYLADGDWIIPEPDGVHYYPCRPDIFEKTYEAVEELKKGEKG